MAPRQTDPDPFDGFDVGWEELGDDNGTLLTFEAGMVEYGTYLHRSTIELPEDKRENGQETADMLVFEYPEGHAHAGKRWSCWVTYQLDKAFEKINEGDFVRIECTGERKASQGSVKIFSVRRRIS